MLDLIIEMFSNKMSKLHIDSRYYYDWISVRSVHYYQEYFSNEDVDALLEVWNSTIMETFRTIIFTSLCIISDWFQNLPLLGKEIWFKSSCNPAAVRPSATVDGHLIEGAPFKNKIKCKNYIYFKLNECRQNNINIISWISDTLQEHKSCQKRKLEWSNLILHEENSFEVDNCRVRDYTFSICLHLVNV